MADRKSLDVAESHPSPPVLRLRLYIAGNAPNSVLAITNIRAICAAHFSRHHLEIVDMLTSPLRALADGVVVTPTLVRILPLPVRRVIGSLTDTEQVLLALSGAP